jgi:phospholipase C
LREHNRSFAGYYQDDLWALGYFADMHEPENSKNIHELDTQFFDDVASGNLADFTWLQPRMTTVSKDSLPTWQHPDASVAEGERLIKQVYEAIRAGPKWEETLFLITYDEHGGFYDHVPPPDQGVPSPDGIPASNGFTFDQLGVRIPTVAVSPWIKRGTIVSEALSPSEQPTPTSAFDSTSIMATTNILLGLDDAVPLGDRMGWANTFAGLVDSLPAARQDCPLTLPEIPPAPEDAWLKQRALPLNHHLEAQLLFYCTQHYAQLHTQGACPGRGEVLHNQGLASDWIVKEAAKFRATLAARERAILG